MTKPISPLRQRMLDDMTFRNMSPNTQKIYSYAVANFSAFHGRSPDKLGIEDIREYRLHLMARGLKATSINPIIGALRFFYGTTLGRKEIVEQIPFARKEDTLPAVLTPQQVVSLLEAEPNLKMRTAFITIYAAGLRVSEVVALTARDIDSARMVIHPAGQGPQGPLRHAVRAAPRHPAELLEAHASAALALPGPRPIEADHNPVAAAVVPVGRRQSRPRRFGHRAYLAAQLCHPSA